MFLVKQQGPLPNAHDTGRELRRHLDRAIGRALVDQTYARRLLADPTLALKNNPLRHDVGLHAIHASSVEDFAAQVHDLFFSPAPRSGRSVQTASPSPRFAA